MPDHPSIRADARVDSADWLALVMLLLGGVLLGLDGLLGLDTLGALTKIAPSLASGLKGLIGIAAIYASGRLLLVRLARNQE